MTKEEVMETVVCFRCGEFSPEVKETTATGLPVCSSCGEAGVVTVQLALDMVNDMFLKGVLFPGSAEIYDDNSMDYDYTILDNPEMYEDPTDLVEVDKVQEEYYQDLDEDDIPF